MFNIMLSLSTVWKSEQVNTGFELLKGILDAGFPSIELDYRITESMFEEIRPALKRRELEVASIHNYFPHPEHIDRMHASGDLFMLSSLDKEEREQGIKFTQKTIQIANDLEAESVILHLGKVEMEGEMDKIFDLLKKKTINSKEAQKFLKKKSDQREAKKQKHLDAVLLCLEKINKEAERQNILVGIENRYYYYEIPSFKELEIILKEFEGSNLRYWHDTGHAQVSEHLSFCCHEDYLKAYSGQLIGVHLHDAVDREDHKAPGTGEVDFEMIKNYLNPNVIRVIEVNSKIDKEELLKATAYLMAKGF
ncbi:MAG: sugar phosphate isomerase/epimerase family protein [bacterium]